MVKKILSLLTPAERKRGIKVTGSIFIVALLDFVGLASLLPVLYYLLEGGQNKSAALYFSLLAVAIVVSKSLISTFLTRYQSKYLLGLYKRLSFNLYSNYYNNGLLFIREKGYSTLGHSVNFMCYTFSERILSPLMRMAGELLLIILVTIALLIYDWRTIVVLYLCFLPFMVLYITVVKKRVKKYGEQEYEAKKQQARIVADTFRGYTELEINNAFPSLQESFLKGMDDVTRNRINMETVQMFPRFLSELAIIIGMVVMVILGGENARMLVGIFAVAAFRLLPALRGLMAGYTQIQNALPCLKVIEEGLDMQNESNSSQVEDLKFERDITISNLSFNYGEKRMDFGTYKIEKGEYVGFCGYSGVGKTTLFNLILGFLSPQEGGILIDGIPLQGNNRKAWLKHIGYVPQEVFIFNGTLAENIALGFKDIDKGMVAKVLDMVSLSDWTSGLPDGLESTLGEGGGKLSGGQKQRIGIARALYKGAKVLLLDEATSALDNNTEKEINIMLDNLRAKFNGLTVLSIAHRESTLAYCSRIINLENDEKN
ncbi:MAG: ABC transporter ATP-binding protein [Bacteroidales bacterium]|nr:ABC transporter ATP-binding protein [Bacteroidales bacterium]